ncbi:TPA: urease accessory UreF family protein [Enterococcus faecium]|uniref:urease accessory protein UreF n=1 Tax=Enterococcus faecium TaxID=1352 RepID=UPI000B3E6585|nr:urease accessory UreF family protein [Enterococcus faecium]
MKYNNIDILNYLDIFQICDSTFPIGSFNHSFGMENYLYNNKIKKNSEFRTWFFNYFKTQFKYGEGLLIKLCYEAIEVQEFEKLLIYDDIITKSTISLETRQGTKLIAKQMLGLVLSIYDENIIFFKEYKQAIEKHQAYGNPAIVFSLIAHHKKLNMNEAFLLYGYSVGSTLIQNAVRSVPLGQKDGQITLNQLIKILNDLYGQISQITNEYLGASVPGIELSQINHEIQEYRLFMS